VVREKVGQALVRGTVQNEANALLAGCHEREETAPSYGHSGHVSSDAQPKADPSDLEFRYRMGAFQNLG
jgi:hypothetical protein